MSIFWYWLLANLFTSAVLLVTLPFVRRKSKQISYVILSIALLSKTAWIISFIAYQLTVGV